MGPTTPRRLGKRRQTWRVLRNSVIGFFNDSCTDWAAALTYYGLLALFPAAIVIVAIGGLVFSGPSTVDAIVNVVRDLVPKSLVDVVVPPVRDVLNKHAQAGFLLSFGLLAALWSSSGYVGVFTRAANAIYGVTETRPYLKLRPQQILIAAVYLIVMAAAATALAFSGALARAIGKQFQLGTAPLHTWQVVQWPVFILLIGLLLGVLYRVVPNVRPQRLRWLALGGVIAWAVWLISSILFGLYVGYFNRYGVTYGSLGAMIIFLVWLYLSNCAILFGAEINAHIAKARGRLRVEHADHPDPTSDVVSRAYPDGGPSDVPANEAGPDTAHGATPDGATPGSATPGSATPDDATPDDAVPDRAAPERAASDGAAQMTRGQRE